jgi:hypothetical protein
MGNQQCPGCGSTKVHMTISYSLNRLEEVAVWCSLCPWHVSLHQRLRETLRLASH